MKTKTAPKQQIDRNNPKTWHIAVGQPAYEAIREMVEALNNADDEQQEQARGTIENDPLSVEVRSGWCSPGSEDYGKPRNTTSYCQPADLQPVSLGNCPNTVSLKLPCSRCRIGFSRGLITGMPRNQSCSVMSGASISAISL